MLIIAIILILLLLTVALGFGLAAFSMRIPRQTLEQARAWQEAHYDFSWYDPLEKSEYTVAAPDGYALHAILVKNPVPTDRYVIISHGYTDNRFGAMKYAPTYLDLGFNVVAYDLRGHGANAPTHCTYSLRESADLDAVIRDTRERYRPRTLGIHGESLGAATSVAVLKYHPGIDFAVADCGFAEIEGVLRGSLRRLHLPGGLVRLAGLCAKLRYGCGYDQMRPIDSLPGNAVPVLFIHGAEDGFISADHSRRMAEADPGFHRLAIIPKAHHAASVLTDPAAYRDHVKRFLDAIGTIR